MATHSKPVSFYAALQAELGRVDTGNWRSRLDALHESNGSWQATADALGVHKRTLERWRTGYQPRRRRDGTLPPRQYVSPDSFTGKIRDAWRADRAAQTTSVDWRTLFISGEIEIYPYPPKHQRMWVGRYWTTPSVAVIIASYHLRDRQQIQADVDAAMTNDYIGTPASLVSVDELRFG